MTDKSCKVDQMKSLEDKEMTQKASTSVPPSEQKEKSRQSKYQKLTGVIAFSRIFATIAGCACGGLLLSQADYWSQRSLEAGKNGWFAKTAKEWEDKTSLSRRELERNRQHLIELGVLEAVKKGMPATTNYRVNYEKLDESIDLILTGAYNPVRPTSKRAGAYSVHVVQTENVHVVQTENVHVVQTENVHVVQTENVHVVQTSLPTLYKLSIYKKFLKDNTKNILSIPPKSLLNARAGKNEENSLGGVAATAGFVVVDNFELTAVELEIKETARGGEEEPFEFDDIDWDKIQSDHQQWESEQLQGIQEEIKEVEVIDCETTPVVRTEKSYADHNILPEGQSSANAAQPIQNHAQAALAADNAAKYIRTFEPDVKRNLDGSEKFPWEMEGDRFRFHAGFEDWMCKRLSVTKFYKALTVGSALTQIRKHIASAKYNNQRRDELFIEWNAMIEDNPASINMTIREIMTKEVATMEVKELLNRQADERFLSREKRSQVIKKLRDQFFIDNDFVSIPVGRIFNERPNWVEELRAWMIEQHPELAKYRHEIKAL